MRYLISIFLFSASIAHADGEWSVAGDATSLTAYTINSYGERLTRHCTSGQSIQCGWTAMLKHPCAIKSEVQTVIRSGDLQSSQLASCIGVSDIEGAKLHLYHYAGFTKFDNLVKGLDGIAMIQISGARPYTSKFSFDGMRSTINLQERGIKALSE
jgi:hypothetical protein